LHKFKNPARSDTLALSHWSKEAEKEEAYPFSKFNKSLPVIQYSDKEYKDHLQHSSWSKGDTDLLFDLCQQFQLKFIIICDRFNFLKSEELRKKEEAKKPARKRDRKCKEKDLKDKK